jgi:1-acyl-sn-glycerol-3-phosphate acyltransferase
VFLFSIVYWLFFLVTLPVLFVPALLIWVFTAWFDRRRVILHLYTSFWACIYIWANPIWSVTVTGRKRIPWRHSVVIAANHQSLIDIPVLFALWRPFKWVSKIENFKIPFIGWNLSLNDHVPLVRGDRDSVVGMMETCRRYLNARTSILIFPEGTRSKTGALGEFKDGAFRLSMDTGRPVVPVAISGTAQTLPKHGLILRDRMDAVVQVLEPIDPAAFDSVESLRDATHAAIAAAVTPSRRHLDEAV